MSVEKSGNRYVVKDSKRTKTLGAHKTKSQAIRQLRAIEISKKLRKSRNA